MRCQQGAIDIALIAGIAVVTVRLVRSRPNVFELVYMQGGASRKSDLPSPQCGTQAV